MEIPDHLMHQNDTVLFTRRKEDALIARLRHAKETLSEENHRLKEENSRLVARTRALEENMSTLETKLRIQRHAWEEIAKRDHVSAPQAQQTRSGGVASILRAAPSPRNDRTAKPPMPSLNLKDLPGSGHGPGSSRPMSARPMSSRPMSARPVSARPPSGRPDARARPFSAREQPTTRPFSARRPLSGRAIGNEEMSMVNDDNKSTSHVFTRFPQQKVRGDSGSFGPFAARTILSQSESSVIAKTISEQSASFESLGIHLQCAWAEVCHGTASEPAPNFFRLAICCGLFDKICGVVGKYSDLLLKLRSELYGCLFLDFNPQKHLPDDTEYSKLLPFFIELKRIDMDKKGVVPMGKEMHKLIPAPVVSQDAPVNQTEAKAQSAPQEQVKDDKEDEFTERWRALGLFQDEDNTGRDRGSTGGNGGDRKSVV